MKNLLIILLSYLTINAFSQVQINTSGNLNDPSYLIDNILIGNGVTTSNHNYIGDSSQIGYFVDSSGLIGMSEGFVLSTGKVDSIGNTGVDTLPWWNYIYDSAWNIIDSTQAVESYFLSELLLGNGDQDLLTIANSVPGLIGQTFTVSQTEDAAILEFDFVPSSDTVKFNYVFASEEYLDFVNSNYNDVFAFLISGPGITGPYQSPIGFPGGAMNIAVVPNSNPLLPITISTVNNVLNSQYYNHDSAATVSAFNGYTDVFTATAVVIPCNLYHIKLAIADGSDGSFDSGVFFEAGSFDATEPGALAVNAVTTDILCHGDTTGTAALCISGGVAPYQTNWYGINPNNLAAGTYNVDVTDAQGSSGGTSFTIAGPSEILITAMQNGSLLESTISGGVTPYNYNWTINGVAISNLSSFTPTQNGTYILSITDANGCIVSSDPVNVTNISTGLNTLSNNKILIYPNPFTEKTIINTLDKSNIKEISIFDNSGRLIFNNHYNNNIVEIKKGNLEKGTYLLIIETNNYISRNKIIIE